MWQCANILSNYLINENSIHEISLICTLALIAFEDQSFKTFTLCYWAANTFGLFTFIRLSPIHWPYRLKCCICIHHYCMIWLFLPVNYVRYIVSLAINYIIYWFLIAFLRIWIYIWIQLNLTHTLHFILKFISNIRTTTCEQKQQLRL